MEYLGTEKQINNSDPVVSVCVTTYQHAPFIEVCLNSILNQETDFTYELIIGEDASKDGTREVCKAYAKKHPDKIRLFLRSRDDVIYINGRATGRFNFIETIKAARGKYIALCDGDDCWIDSQKLQKQYNVFQENQNIGLVATSYKVFYQNKDTYETKKFNNTIISKDDILTKNFICSSSSMFLKKYAQLNHYGIKNKWQMADFPLWLTITEHADAYLLEDVCALYRRLEGSQSRPVSLANKVDFIFSKFDIRRAFVPLHDIKKQMHIFFILIQDIIQLIYHQLFKKDLS